MLIKIVETQFDRPTTVTDDLMIIWDGRICYDENGCDEALINQDKFLWVKMKEKFMLDSYYEIL